MTPRPRVTIGLAVYNGEPYLAETLDCLLGQTFGDLELVICDNASTDATEEQCRAVAASDDRVRYHRNPENIGGVRNENRTLFLARGELYKLAAHDDLVSADFVERCVAVLDARPDVELCVPEVGVIDEHGAPRPHHAPVAGLEATAAERIRAVADPRYMCEAIYGVARTAALRAVRPQGNHYHSDRTVLAELAARAPFALAEGALLLRRIHPGNQFEDSRSHVSWFEPELKATGDVRFPNWSQLGSFAGMVERLPVGSADRIRCTGEVARWSWLMRRSLVADVVWAGRTTLAGKAERRRRYETEGMRT